MPGGNTYTDVGAGRHHGVVLSTTPVPEPPSLLALICGLSAVKTLQEAARVNPHAEYTPAVQGTNPV